VRATVPGVLSESWATLWEAIADELPDHAAVVVGDRRSTWRELDQRAARLASGLAGLGVGPDVKVAQLLYNCPEYLETVYAAFKLRAVPLNVNHRYLADEIVHVLGNADAEVLVFHGTLAGRVADARARLPQLRAVLQVDDGGPLLEGAHWYEDLVAESEPAARIERSGADTLLLYTGGTTGLPKGVVWGHEDLWGALAFIGYVSMGLDMPESPADVGRIAAELNDGHRSPVNLCAPPLMHGTALFLAIQTFVLGGTVVLLGGRRFDADELLRLVERERVTQISVVGDAFARPIVAALAAAEAAGRPYDLSSVQRVVSTGATFSADSKRGLTSRQPMAILDMIGASEGGPYAVNMTLPGQDPGETAAFTATPNTVLFDDATWERLPPGAGRTGVLAVAGAMPRGYLKDDAKTAATFRVIDGVRYTVPGDYAQIDADGTVHLLGRGSVCINTGGEKVYPEEVEVAARAHPGVADCNAVGVPDERFGEAVALVVARAPGEPAVSETEVIAAVRERLAAYKAPKVVVFVDEIVRSPAGKSDYRWARRVAARAEAGGG
jgi:acyl-CoA synthetase (AMP-forming)/AMP-acid ligase II